MSRTAALAALAMSQLAAVGGLVRAREVAAHLDIPVDSALKILQALCRRGLLQSQLGRGGGYQMCGPADSVTLLEVVEAIDGPIAAVTPVPENERTLSAGLDALRVSCERAVAEVRQIWSETTIHSLVTAGVQPQNMLAA